MTYPTVDIEYGTFRWLRREVGVALGIPANEEEWDHDQSERVNSIIQSGYMQMLFPPPLAAPREGAPAPKPHRWSFLNPVGVLPIRAGEDTYRLPDDFAGALGDFTIRG